MTTLGVDYAWQHPDPAALAAAGYRFACRYLSRDQSKNLTLAEAEALAAHGIAVVANWEYGAQDMLRGHAGGVTDAQLALAQAVAAGMPSGRPIYFSADWDVTPAQEAAVSAYLTGVDSVLGAARAGLYAGFYPVKIARDAGLVAWSWQSAGWSGGQWDLRDQIRQTGTAVVGGVQVDVNQAMTADYGQWFPTTTKTPTATAPSAQSLEEDEMPQQIEPLSLHAGGQYAYDVPDGKTQIRLTADGNNNPGAQLRIAYWNHDGVTVPDEKPNYTKVGGNSGHHTVGIKLPSGCTGVTITREDNQNFPVALGFHA